MSDMNKLIKGIGNKNKDLINKEENLLYKPFYFMPFLLQ